MQRFSSRGVAYLRKLLYRSAVKWLLEPNLSPLIQGHSTGTSQGALYDPTPSLSLSPAAATLGFTPGYTNALLLPCRACSKLFHWDRCSGNILSNHVLFDAVKCSDETCWVLPSKILHDSALCPCRTAFWQLHGSCIFLTSQASFCQTGGLGLGVNGTLARVMLWLVKIMWSR